MSIRDMIMSIVRAESRTRTGNLRKILPTWTMKSLTTAVDGKDFDINKDSPYLLRHSIRARISELVRDGFLEHDGETPRNYNLSPAGAVIRTYMLPTVL